MKDYTFEDLEKCPIGTKITFEDGSVLVKSDKNHFDDEKHYRNTVDLRNFKDEIGTFGKIIKIEEPSYTTVYEREKEILDKVEKRYLSNLIRPFRSKVTCIEKHENYDDEYILISVEKEPDIFLPNFSSGTMYKGMKPERKYSLEELGL